VRVHGVSPLQWHPFSAVPAAQPNRLVVHVKGYGAWTRGLVRQLLHDGNAVVRVDGPYGELQHRPEWTRHRTLVIIAGGIGVRTPLHRLDSSRLPITGDPALDVHLFIACRLTCFCRSAAPAAVALQLALARAGSSGDRVILIGADKPRRVQGGRTCFHGLTQRAKMLMWHPATCR
jgi:hypothetical protein